MSRIFLLLLRPTWRGALIGALCGLASWLIALHPFFRGLEEWCQDACFAYRGRRDSAARVILVGIDDATLAALPKPLTSISPELGEVVTYLRARGARAVGLDLMIPETPDGYDRDNNLGGSALGLAAGRADKVVLPIILGDSGDPVLPLSTWQTGSPLGFVDLSEDRDHIVRGQQLAARVDHKPYDQFALALLNAVGRAGTDNQGIPHVDYQTIPLDAEGRLRINFVGPPGTIPRLSFAEVWAAAKKSGPPPLDQRGRRVDLKDTIVVIGATTRSLGDYHATPYANGTWRVLWTPQPRLMSGPEVQANIVATLDDGAYITTPWWLATLPLVTGIGAALGAIFARLNLVHGAMVAAAHHLAWSAACLAAFCFGTWRVEMVAMLMTGPICYGATFALRWRWLRRMFGTVKGEAIARVLENDPGHLLLRGEERIITVLFADIRGFTAYSHGHTPREIIALLNAYFGAVVPILEDQGGTIDKYIGDGVMVIFGAPGDQPDHAPRAVRAAVRMVTRVHEMKQEWDRLDCPNFRIGVGIQTGAAVVGTVGSPMRLDYTAHGDIVNAASRTESVNKDLGTEILIGARTLRALSAQDRSRLGCADQPDRVNVKGIPSPLELHRVVVPPRPSGDGTQGLNASMDQVSIEEPAHETDGGDSRVSSRNNNLPRAEAGSDGPRCEGPSGG